MPTIDVNGARLYYEDTGGDGPPILFCHGLLWSLRMFDDQVAALRSRYRCVAFDFRGQGRSEVTAVGYDMDTLADDAAALIATLGLAPCHVAGLSMGGFVAMRLAARRPQLVRSLILLETSADAQPVWTMLQYRVLALVARWLGLRLVAGRAMAVMFGRKFLGDPARAAQREASRRQLIANDVDGARRALDGVISRAAVLDELGAVGVPTLVIVGDQDVATPPENARRIQAAIAGSKLVLVPGAGHTSPVEEPAAVTAAIAEFLASSAP